MLMEDFMRISTKGRYGLAAMITMVRQSNTREYITIISIAEKLGLSKIYLEQVFSLLKRAELVNSVKGAQGGYQIAKPIEDITAYQILNATEQFLFEKTDKTISQNALNIEIVMETMVFEQIDIVVAERLQKITLRDLVNQVEKLSDTNNMMFYI